MDRFELAMKCRVPQWLPSVYHTLCIRDKHITAEEGRKLGHERLTEICRIRELRPKLSIDERCGGCKACTTKLTSAHMTWPPCTAAIQVDVTKLITEATDLRANFPGEEVKGVEANADSVAKESMGQLPAIEDATTSVVLTPCPVQNEDAPKFILAKCLGCKRKLKRGSKWGMCKKCRDQALKPAGTFHHSAVIEALSASTIAAPRASPGHLIGEGIADEARRLDRQYRWNMRARREIMKGSNL
ncbi:hypothetical protein FRB93_011859 [Tulasnella sp. JGI-2019a]|nr:hypothetical protein FRB93_011859 [Tulasnella sp. JGI-2019a]